MSVNRVWRVLCASPAAPRRAARATADVERAPPARRDYQATSPTALAEQAIADAERAMARSEQPRGSPFDDRSAGAARATAARESSRADPRNYPEPEPAPTPERRGAAAAAAGTVRDEVRLEGRGLTAVPARLGEDRPGRVRPRKIDLSDNKLATLSGLPQSVVQLRAAGNLLADWEGVQTLPRLQRLDLSHNQIHHMGPFGICCAIRVLRLKGNRISTLVGIEGVARTLAELDVSDNSLRSVDDIQPLTGCTRLALVGLQGNPLLEGIAQSVKSRAFRGIMARLPEGCKLLDESSASIAPLFTPTRAKDKASAGGTPSSSYSERRKRQGTPSSTTARSDAAFGGSWPRRVGSVRRGDSRADVDGSTSTVAVDLSAPRQSDAHTLSSLQIPLPGDVDDTEPYQPAVRGENLYAHTDRVARSSPRETIFSTGGTGACPNSPKQHVSPQQSRQHWSPSGRRRDSTDAKRSAVGRRSPSNKHLSFIARESKVVHPLGNERDDSPSPVAADSSASLQKIMTPTKSIESKYSRPSPPREKRDDVGRLSGHPGWPTGPPPSAPSPNQSDSRAANPQRPRSTPRQRELQKTMFSTGRTGPRPISPKQRGAGQSGGGTLLPVGGGGGGDELGDSSDTVKGLNDKITKLYNWHLAEMDLVQQQQLQLNHVTAELEQTRSELRLRETTGTSGSMPSSPEQLMGATGAAYNSPEQQSVQVPSPSRADDQPEEDTVVALPPAQPFGTKPGRQNQTGGLKVPTPMLDSSATRPSIDAEWSESNIASTNVPLPPEPTATSIELSGIPLSSPVRLQDLQASTQPKCRNFLTSSFF